METTQTQQNTKDIKTMSHPTLRQDLFHPTRILYTFVFMSLFLFIGWLVPKIYFDYLDNTQYISVKQPVQINKEIYKKGEDISVTIVRSSVINVKAHIIIQVHLVNDDKTQTKYLTNNDIAITVSKDEVFSQKYILPSNIPNGHYHLEAVITYPFRDKTKTYSWQSVTFLVDDTEKES